MERPAPVRLAEGQIMASAEVLARAFADDGYFTYFLSDLVERGRLMLPFKGLGFGGLLLRAGLARVDRDGVECHVFTEQPRSVPIYRRFGFEVAVEGDVPDMGPHFWFMRRKPHAVGP